MLLLLVGVDNIIDTLIVQLIEDVIGLRDHTRRGHKEGQVGDNISFTRNNKKY